MIRFMLALAILSFFATAYVRFRPQVFKLLASGTEWVLVACGLTDRDNSSRPDDRLRKLYFAIRMFKGTPPRDLAREDAEADMHYPGMGFGLVHTFSKIPIKRVIGGWLFEIPCSYFSDARDCQDNNTGIALLKVGTSDLNPITPKTVDYFLAASSSETMHVTLTGLEQRKALWWQIDPRGLTRMPVPPTGYKQYALAGVNGGHYHLYVPAGSNGVVNQFQCIDSSWAKDKQIMDHCLMRFMYNEDVVVEIKFPVQVRNQWGRLREETRRLVSTFQARR